MGGSGAFDPILQKYYADVWEIIQESWHSPSLSVSKGLLAVVSIKIRKDGRIADFTIEQRSGNRAYDESIARALRSIDTLPPLPPSLNTDFLEVGFNFHPPGVTR
jgi:TonB family protein